MQEITHINVNGVTYALAGSSSGGGVTIFTPEGAGTAVPISGLIEKVYFNTNLSASEVHAILDEAVAANAEFTAVIGTPLVYVIYGTSGSDSVMLGAGRMTDAGGYMIAASTEGEAEEENIFFIYADEIYAEASGAPFVGWNPDITELTLNATNMVDVFAAEAGMDPAPLVAVNEILASLISTTPF